jgi:hypothetical protein
MSIGSPAMLNEVLSRIGTPVAFSARLTIGLKAEADEGSGVSRSLTIGALRDAAHAERAGKSHAYENMTRRDGAHRDRWFAMSRVAHACSNMRIPLMATESEMMDAR